MSTTRDWQGSDALDDRLGQPESLRFPDDWTLSTSWQRAQTERDEGGPVNDAERMVFLEDSEYPHRVTFALSGRSLRAECDCDSYHYRGWCAHLASCWWQWVRGRIEVTHLDTGRTYDMPPSWIRFQPDTQTDLSALTEAEMDAYLACDLGGVGVTEYAQATDRVKGTIGTLLGRAREKVGGRR